MSLWDRFNNPETRPLIIPKPDFRLDVDIDFDERFDGETALVIGTAPCVRDDVKEALELFPGSYLCGVNEATSLFACDFAATCHPEKIGMFRQKDIRQMRKARRPLWFAQVHKDIEIKNAVSVDMSSGAGSSIFAVKVMILLGFSRVIMCGCPMNGGDGYAMDDTHKGHASDPRFGHMSPDSSLALGWKNNLRILANDARFQECVFSMSGFTKELYGAPNNG